MIHHAPETKRSFLSKTRRARALALLHSSELRKPPSQQWWSAEYIAPRNVSRDPYNPAGTNFYQEVPSAFSRLADKNSQQNSLLLRGSREGERKSACVCENVLSVIPAPYHSVDGSASSPRSLRSYIHACSGSKEQQQAEKERSRPSLDRHSRARSLSFSTRDPRPSPPKSSTASQSAIPFCFLLRARLALSLSLFSSSSSPSACVCARYPFISSSSARWLFRQLRTRTTHNRLARSLARAPSVGKRFCPAFAIFFPRPFSRLLIAHRSPPPPLVASIYSPFCVRLLYEPRLRRV